jgi:hypothetical protein
LDAETEIREYVHRALNQEVAAIGGFYVLIKEARLSLGGRQLLYLIGHAAFETACCGVSGCAYALVPGFIVRWKGETDGEGHAISQLVSIRDSDVQEQVRRLIGAREDIHQVVFQ